MMPVAPGRLSTKTVLPSVSLSRFESTRAIRSLPPPGAYATTTRIVLLGNSSAAFEGRAAAAKAKATTSNDKLLVTGIGFSLTDARRNTQADYSVQYRSNQFNAAAIMR